MKYTVKPGFSKLSERHKNAYYCQVFSIYHVIYAMIANFGKKQKVYQCLKFTISLLSPDFTVSIICNSTGSFRVILIWNNYQQCTIITIDNQSDYKNFTIYPAYIKLIGCLEREFLKNGLIFDDNSSPKVTSWLVLILD